MDREKILKNLLSKTVERGCSKAEADAAQVMAKKKAAEWGMNLEAVGKSLFLDGLSRRERSKIEGVSPFEELFRRAAQHAARRAYSETTPTPCSHRRRWAYKGMPEAFRCKDCGFFTQEWQEQKDKKYWADMKANRKAHQEQKDWKQPRKPKQTVQSGCTNPFGVHGKGTDPTGKWESVADFVMWHLKNTDMPFEEIALQSRMRFSGKTSKNSVAWYANKIKKQGGTIPERSK